MHTIVDVALQQIRTEVAEHPPERGGVLLGPADSHLLTAYVHDNMAKTTAASYIPSSKLIADIPRMETQVGLVAKGIVHSHPRGLSRPSAGDERTMRKFFELNPHHGHFALPIVQQVARDDEDPDFIHFYHVSRCLEIVRMRGRPPRRVTSLKVHAVDHEVLPLGRDMDRFLSVLMARGLPMQRTDRLLYLRMNGATLVGLRASGADGRELFFFVAGGYPMVAPLVLAARPGADTVNVAGHWEGINAADASLHRLAAGLAAQWQPHRAHVLALTCASEPIRPPATGCKDGLGDDARPDPPPLAPLALTSIVHSEE